MLRGAALGLVARAIALVILLFAPRARADACAPGAAKLAAFLRAERRLANALLGLAGASDRAALEGVEAEVTQAIIAYDEAAKAYDDVIANLPRGARNRLTGQRFEPRARAAGR